MRLINIWIFFRKTCASPKRKTNDQSYFHQKPIGSIVFAFYAYSVIHWKWSHGVSQTSYCRLGHCELIQVCEQRLDIWPATPGFRHSLSCTFDDTRHISTVCPTLPGNGVNMSKYPLRYDASVDVHVYSPASVFRCTVSSRLSTAASKFIR